MGEGKKLKYDSQAKKMCKEAITGSKDWKDKEEKVLQAFKSWDKDGNGFISKEELADVLVALGCPAEPNDLDVMLKEADLDLDGKINYEEMVHWLCRAPHLEQYFLKSMEIFKQNYVDTSSEMFKLQKEALELKKKLDSKGIESGVEEDSPEAAMVMVEAMRFTSQAQMAIINVVKATQKKMEDELPAVITQSFRYHDKDSSGTLTYDESIIFFSNFVALYEPFAQVMSELNVIFKETDTDLDDLCGDGPDAAKDLEDSEKKRDEKVKLITPDKMHEVFKQKYAVLKEERAKNIDEHQKKAFEVLSTDGKIEEASLREALMHGTEKNSEFLRALNLEVQEVMKDASKRAKEMESQKEEMEEAMAAMEGMLGALATLGAMGAAMEGGGSIGEIEMSEGDCNMQ